MTDENLDGSPMETSSGWNVIVDGGREAPHEGPTQPPNEQWSSANWPAPPAPPSTPSASKPRRNDWRQRVTLLLVAALIGGLAGHFTAQNSTSTNSVTIKQTNEASSGAVLPSGLTIPQLVERVTPSVVSVDVRTSSAEDQGTGMILTSSGLIMTNNHVIAAALTGGTITITRSGSTKTIPAVLVGTDPAEDVALIRAEGVANLPTVTLGNSNKLVTGDSVVAIGNALGLAAGTPTVTSGIVSALGRTVTAGDGSSSETLHNMIQTDAAINPGNSGGPLLDSNGHVIGMNTAVAGTLSDGSSAQNIGFAIPVAEIKLLLPSLLKGGTVTKRGAYLGVEITTMTPQLAKTYGFKTTTGALVMTVVPGSAAQQAGIQQGDIIVQIGNRTIRTETDVTAAMRRHHAGDVVPITVIRNDQRVTVTATLGATPG
jgi:putative serine protease PepD